jgi:hypothetical protein
MNEKTPMLQPGITMFQSDGFFAAGYKKGAGHFMQECILPCEGCQNGETAAGLLFIRGVLSRVIVSFL